MTTIFVKDDLRAAVENATGGLCSVHYTASGVPCVMRIVPNFKLEDVDASLGTGVHPAFIVDGQTVGQIWIGVYQGLIRNGELLSVAGVDPTVSLPYTSFVSAARQNGPGFHLMTNAEWAAMMLWCAKNGYQPRGNTSYGRSNSQLWETAARVDGGTPGSASGTPRTRTGTGPIAWRHDNSLAGISDPVGNTWEFTPGARLVDGEIQILENNNAASASVFGDTAAWKAVKADGSLVAPGTAGSLKYDSLTAGTSGSLGSFQIDDVVDNRNGPAGDGSSAYGYNSMAFSSLAADAGITIPGILKAIGLAPSLSVAGTIWMRNHGQRYPLRGAGWYDTGGAGLGALNLIDAAAFSSWSVGGRLAMV